MRTIALFAAIFALSAAPALAASSAPAAGPYTLDSKGKCHSSDGKFAKKALCASPAAPKHCRDPKTGKFAKCTAPGAVPA
jgi:hypothetical protein